MTTNALLSRGPSTPLASSWDRAPPITSHLGGRLQTRIFQSHPQSSWRPPARRILARQEVTIGRAACGLCGEDHLRYIDRTAEFDRKVNRGTRRAAAYDQSSRSRWQANIIRIAYSFSMSFDAQRQQCRSIMNADPSCICMRSCNFVKRVTLRPCHQEAQCYASELRV